MRKEEGWAWGQHPHPVKQPLLRKRQQGKILLPGTQRNAVQKSGPMTLGDQSREEVSSPKADLLSPKQHILVGCWNVRTLYQTGKLAQAVKEMAKYNLSLLGITEARWTGTGKQKTITGEEIIWSGRKDNQHQEGVALIIKKELAKSLLEWKPINQRLLYVRLNSKYAKLSIIVAYAPTDTSQEEDKDEFYEAYNQHSKIFQHTMCFSPSETSMQK